MSKSKFIFVTGGVTSSLGKGIIASALGNLFQSRGYRTTIIQIRQPIRGPKHAVVRLPDHKDIKNPPQATNNIQR